MNALVIANGELTTHPDQLSQEAGFELILAVDGGYKHCQALGIIPQVVLGDFDSLQQEAVAELGIEAIPFPANKDEIDLELALLHAVDAGAIRVIILAGLGGRVDMTLANLSLLTHPQLRDTPIEFWHNDQKIWRLSPPGGEINGEPGDTVSLIPFFGDAGPIHTTHLAYPLEAESLPIGPARGVSNLLEARQATVKIDKGSLLVVLTRGHA